MVSLTRLAVLAGAALHVSALGLPSRGQGPPPHPPHPPFGPCMRPPDVQTIVWAYQQLIANYSDALCERFCAPDLYDFSDSISTLAGRPTGQPLVSGKQAFMASQKRIPPSPLVVGGGVPLASCDRVAVVWTAAFGPPAKSARGITLLTTTPAPAGPDAGWLIKGIDVEFNSLAWLEDAGGSYTLPPPPPPAQKA
ncbi:hypothetical protein F4809DRAFT_265982 [Biscogniauxia mediterranea]|nr:hypothetical protein F4809DRAFT_265982 [Biscogniauxia mediterranea]